MIHITGKDALARSMKADANTVDLYQLITDTDDAESFQHYLDRVDEILGSHLGWTIEFDGPPGVSEAGTCLAVREGEGGTVAVHGEEEHPRDRTLASFLLDHVLEEGPRRSTDSHTTRCQLRFLKRLHDRLSPQETPYSFVANLQELFEQNLSLAFVGCWVIEQDEWIPLGDSVIENALVPPSPEEFDDDTQVVRSEGVCYVPVLQRDRPLGLMAFDHDDWSGSIESLLGVLTASLGEYFERMKQLETAALHETYEFGHRSTPSSEELKTFEGLEEMFQSLVETIARMFECDNCRLFWRESSRALKLRAESRETSDRDAQIVIDQDPLVQSVIKQEKAILINDLPEQQPGRRSSRGVRSILAVPFRFQDRVLGTINLSSENPDVYTPSDLELLSEVCDNFATIYGITQEYANLTSYVEEVLAHLPVGVINLRLQPGEVVINQAARELLQLESERIPRDEFEEHVRDTLDADPLLDLMEREHLDSERTMGPEDVEIARAEMPPLIVEALSSVVQNVEEEDTGVLIVLADVTEQRKLTQQMNRNERLRALGELASSLAHEIKNPLTSIQGFVQLIPNRTGDQEFLEKTAGILEDETRRLNSLVENLLSFGKPQVGSQSDILLEDVVEDLNLLIQKRIEEEELAFYRDIPEGLTIYADPLKIKQVLLNLALNAIDATESGGEIHIRARKNQTGNVVVVVEDTGVGMDDDQQARIFNPFFTTKDDGTGLGMAISHRIVEEHGGNIRVRSEPGEGTEVIVELPPGEQRETNTNGVNED